MTIKDWPKLEKPRERLIHYGASALSDAELLAIFIRTGTRENDAISLARIMLKQSNGLRGLLNMKKKEIEQFSGIGETKYVQIKAALELGKRYLYAEKLQDKQLNHPEEVADYLKIKLRDKEHEVFAVIFLDNLHRILHYQELFRGSVNMANVPIREVVKDALQYNAVALIVAHNHPSGTSEPSMADKTLTKRLSSALSLVDIRLLDHLIIGEGQAVSLAKMGFL